MKKKTSLWISGITTVAMLAVAVGSFAAWNTLTKDTDAFTATTDTRVELDVQNIAGDSDVTADASKKLVPDSVLKDTDMKKLYDETSVSELAVGAFTLSRADNKTASDIKVAATSKVTVGGAEDTTNYSVKIYSYDTANTKWNTTPLTEDQLKNLTEGNYLVKLSFSSTVENGAKTMASADANKLADKTPSVTVTCTATKSAVTP